MSASTVAFHGVGVMGSAILAGLIASGHPVDQVLVTDAHEPTAQDVASRHGVRAVSAQEAAAQATVHVLAVKPADIPALLATLSQALPTHALVISVAAGVTLAALQDGLPEDTAVVRVMPNTPALVGEGMAALAPGSAAAPEQVEQARAILAASGRAVVVPEKYLDAVTAVSGSGPAYLFYLAEAMIEGGVLLGLPRPTATELAHQTLLGAATMLVRGDDSATVLRERVSSPGGTTMAALHTLDERAVRAAVVAAEVAAARRAAELGAPPVPH